MGQLLVHHRRWAYLVYAVGMLSVPFIQGHIDSTQTLRDVTLALLILTLMAYLELFFAAERGSLRYRKMAGNPDLLILADTHPIHTFPSMWAAWIGGWNKLTFIALIIGRFTVALCFSLYLHFFTPDFIPSIFTYVSHNGYYDYWWPVWEQVILAIGILIVLGLAESALMLALATLVYTRVRRRQTWRVLFFLGGRGVLGLGALIGIFLMSGGVSVITEWAGLGTAQRYPTYICYDSDGEYAPQTLPAPLCRDILLVQQVHRASETVQIALFSHFDAGIMTAASLMRPHQSRRFLGEGLSYRAKYVNPNIGTFGGNFPPTYWLISPWWLLLRMSIAGLLAALLMRGSTRLLWRRARYET